MTYLLQQLRLVFIREGALIQKEENHYAILQQMAELIYT